MLEDIGSMGFANNYLKTIDFPSSLKTLGPGAFQSNLIEHLVIPPTIWLVSDYTFAGNPLKTIHITSSSVGQDSFTAPDYSKTILTVDDASSCQRLKSLINE